MHLLLIHDKPWITKDTKMLSNEKKQFINIDDYIPLKASQKLSYAKISQVRRVYV